MKPKPVNNLEIALGLANNTDKYLPKWEEIPEDFKRGYGEAQKWVKTVNDIFYCGVNIVEVKLKDGIDKKLALGHLMAVLLSFEPKHEHKMAGVSYLMSLWFDDLIYIKGKDEGIMP